MLIPCGLWKLAIGTNKCLLIFLLSDQNVIFVSLDASQKYSLTSYLHLNVYMVHFCVPSVLPKLDGLLHIDVVCALVVWLHLWGSELDRKGLLIPLGIHLLWGCMIKKGQVCGSASVRTLD